MKRDGYTVIELMAVIAIVGILLTVGAIQFREYYQRQGLKRAVHELATDLRIVRERTKTERINATIGFTPCGYGYSVITPNQRNDKSFENVTFTPSTNPFFFDAGGMTNQTINIAIRRVDAPNQTSSISINTLGILRY